VRVRAWRREFDEGREQLAPAGDAFTDDAGLYRIFGLEPGDYILCVPAVQVTMPLAAANGVSAGGSAEASALLGLNRASDPNDRRVQPDGRHVLIAGRNATAPPPDRGLTFAYRTEFYPGFEVPSDALPVTVGPGDDRIGVHFQLHLVETHRVSGIVVGREGPLAHQLVRLVLDGADDQGFGSEAATTMTDTDGTFALLNVPGGRYTLEVRALGSVLTAASPAAAVAMDDVSPAASATRGWGRAPVAVWDADLDDVIVAVRPGGAIDGRLVVEGERQPSSAQLSRLTIGLLPADRGVGGALATHLDSMTRFGFSNLVPAPYFLRVRDTPPGWSVKSLTAGGRDLLDQPLDLEDAAEVVVTLTDHPTEIWGMVRDWRGVPTSGATVLVLPAPASGNAGLNPNRMREVRAATSGVYTIAGLPAGEYSIVAIDDAAAEGWQDPRRADALRVLGTRVTLRAGEKTMIDLRLPGK